MNKMTKNILCWLLTLGLVFSMGILSFADDFAADEPIAVAELDIAAAEADADAPEGLAMLSAEDSVSSISIKRAQVMNGGANQIIWRNAEKWDISLYTVYKGDDPVLAVNGEDPALYYTTARMVNLQDPRRFTLEIKIPKGDFTGIGTAAGEFNPANVSITYTSNGTQTLVPANTRVLSAVIGEEYVVVEAEIETTGVGLTSSSATNYPYTPYYNAGRPSSANWNRIGVWPLNVSYTGMGVVATMQLRTSYNDSIQRWREVDVWAKDYISKWPEGTTEYSEQGRYMLVESAGQSTLGRDMWSMVISDSKKSVDDYLNVTVPLMNEDPASMQRQIEEGTFDHKGTLIFTLVHGNEIQGNGILVDLRDRLLHKEKIKFTVRDVADTRWIAPTSMTNSSAGTRVNADRGKVVDQVLDVDAFLDEYIVVILFVANPDGNESPARAGNFGNDPNRDGGQFNFKETKNTMRLVTKWDPIYLVETHDNVSTFQIDGCTPPLEASLEADLIDSYMVNFLEAIGYGAIGNSFNHFNIPMRDMVQGWDAAALVYDASIPMMHGSLGSTLEFPTQCQDAIDSGLQGFINLLKYVSDERAGVMNNKLEFKRRGVENIDAKDKVDPLLTSIDWRFERLRGVPQSQGGLSFNLSTLVKMPRPRLKDADGNELSFFPEYWVVPVDRSLQYSPQGALESLVNLQDWGGVKIDRTTEQVTGADGVVYPAGTYLIDMHQGRRSFANSVFYYGFDTSNFSGLYDSQTVVSWPAMKGFNALRVWETGLFDGITERVDMTQQTILPGDGEYVIYANAGHDSIRLTNRLLDNGRPVWMVTGYIPGASIGDYVAKRTDVFEMIQPMVNPQLGSLALSVVGIDGGNEPPADGVAKQLVRPIIAVSRPGTTSVNRLMYDSLEFFNFSNGSTTTGSVWVGSGAPANNNIPAFMWSATAANVVTALGTGAVAAGNPSGQAEMVGQGEWIGTSTIATNYGSNNVVFTNSANKYLNPRSDIKVLGKFVTTTNGADIYMGGRRGLANSTGYSGRIVAVTGIRANGTGVTAIGENVGDRNRAQGTWHLLGSSVFAYAAGITDIPRPTVAADYNKAETGVDFTVSLDILAEDTAGVNATIATKKYKINNTLLEPAYDPADPAWKDIPAGDKVTVFDVNNSGGEYYLHWYVENSKGVASQGNLGPYVKVPVGITLSAPEVSGIENDVVYTLSLSRAGNVLDLELEFVVDGNMLAFMDIEPLNGFERIDGISWKSLGGDVWKGSVTLGYPSGDGTGFTLKGTADIAKFVFAPRALGETTVELTSVKVAGLRNEVTAYIDFVIEAGKATTFIDKLVYSKYDLNKDGIVDALDLGIMLLYCGFDSDSPNWATLVKVKDSRGNGVTASMCDVNGDGMIDMLDLLDLFLHYTK
ncbi:MAG: dockerin type I domain-containing protein [Clostridiales bacterium]|nr:dockerin type I domain-containing protein [Clostridiales bacterium]